MRLGVLGGTFDPVHLGHLALARVALDELKLAKVLFVPAARPRFKTLRRLAPAQARLDMLRLAVAGEPRFEVSTIDLERAGTTYTVDTLLRLKQELGESVELYFLLGADALAEFPAWRAPERILGMCYLVTAARPGCPPPDLVTLEQALPASRGRVIVLQGPHIDVSATEVRRRVAAGQPLSGLVPPAVEQYIKDRGLYRRARPEPPKGSCHG
ncbi:MAG: nicotinate-nucleotide adenylyltransferase [Chloroflexi bacterium]|nr:nicotinate-nucleotide adenylyltransferase [Chloroflexota bacterium]